uniref:mRNA n=1 Tax=Oulactis sp. TaxID=2093647 RepID=A0A8J9XB30_OULSP|nr:mRNA [Oulactis sp. MM-2018]CAG9553028.1 mRNA [Oulactis sp. MM-2018]
MASRYHTIHALSILLLVLIYQAYHVTSTPKSGKIDKYCGEQFISAWSVCCGNNPKCENSKRQVQDEDDILTLPMFAKRFLLSRRQLSSINKRGSTDAVEECCNEGCSLSEIAEYQC